ncbi:HD-GYP domain-containing protein [Rhizobium sp. 9140]|uniref:HD-GYP domain-containing protein n=1 Tax=Rhizobium sp. 9140 TaxID=1761900 RepID=UPI000791E09F|nr:HD-GYP domain-containing protein [Rhizobium sp. 9140]CZT33640.1 HD domain-containing protein [Rhizobium sp. 9140]
MVKRIERHEARVGMFIESLEGAWQDNPFGQRRFLLRSETEVDLIKNSRITGIYINLAKGVDVDGSNRSFANSSQPRSPPPPKALLDERRATVRVVQASVKRLEAVFIESRCGEPINIESVSEIVGDISTQIGNSPAILLDITRLKSKDKVTFVHSVAVSALLVHFARHLHFEEPLVRVLGFAGLVHDIGKLAIPTAILNKASVLTAEEREIVMQHPAIGHDILKRQGNLPGVVLDICRHHHERMNSKGYPDGIPAGELSIYVRMSTICDVYEAVTSVRPYKKPWSSATALSWMLQHGDHFDTQLLWKFILSLDSELTRGVA